MVRLILTIAAISSIVANSAMGQNDQLDQREASPAPRHDAKKKSAEPTGAARAEKDLTVLPAQIDGQPARTMMQRFMGAHADLFFRRWRARYEALQTEEQISAYQKTLRAEFLKRIGGLPDRTPLRSQVTGVIQLSGFRIEKVLFESRPKHFVSSNVYIPDAPAMKQPFPGVLIVCGHAKEGKAYEMYARAAALCALNGMVAVVIDPIDQGERIQWLDETGSEEVRWGTYAHTVVGVSAVLLGQNTARFEIWDAMRAIDYLQSRPDVDPKRIGVTGNSGGGTQTAYIMALDDRVAAAAPSCYLTSFERLLATIGPQDAEQNIFGQLDWGMDHADYILIRAPKPTLIAANTKDFFDIDGTWRTFRDAKRLYVRLGAGDRVDLNEIDAEHGFHKASRAAVVRFLIRHLGGKSRPVAEPNDWIIPSETELWAAPNGMVMRLPDARSVYDLMADDLAAMTIERPALSPETIRSLAGIPPVDRIPVPVVERGAVIERDRYTIAKLVFRLEPDADGVPPILLPGLLFASTIGAAGGEADLVPIEPSPELLPRAPESGATTLPAGRRVLYVDADGKSAAAAPGGEIEKLVLAGAVVLAIDLRGTGETFDRERQFYYDAFGGAGKEAIIAYLLGKSYVGLRTTDILSAAGWLARTQDTRGDTIDLIAVGHVGVPALHAAVVDRRLFNRVEIRNTLESWASVIHTRKHRNQLDNMVHGVLRAYDLPDLRGAIGARLSVVGLVDPLGREVAADQ